MGVGVWTGGAHQRCRLGVGEDVPDVGILGYFI